MTALCWDRRRPGGRAPVIASEVIATSHPLAAQAGMSTFAAGGNAVDAALAAAIALTVLEPVSTGLGGDGFALIHEPGEPPLALNATGRAPAAWTPDRVGSLAAVPLRGWASATVPGTVSMWADLSQRFGRLPFADLFVPAIDWATRGAPVAPNVRERWRLQADGLREQPGFAEAYLPDGRVPAVGAVLRQPDLARSLALVAESRGREFYEGRLAEALVAHAAETGGTLSMADLAAHRNEWQQPLAGAASGAVDLRLAPPNSQALVIELTLGVLSHFDAPFGDPDGEEGRHLQIEAFKLASADVAASLGDPAGARLPLDELRAPERLRRRATEIGRRAGAPQSGLPKTGGTVAVVAADAEGRSISLLQSNYEGFGSGVVVPGTGISLHNRLAGFRLSPGHPNHLTAGRRPLHTLMPTLLTQGGMPLAAIGVAGGNMQPQTQIALLLRMLGRGDEPQSAINAPRHRHMAGMAINVEAGIADDVVAGLAARGHAVAPLPPGYFDFGSAQMLWRSGESWVAATDGRKDGAAAGR